MNEDILVMLLTAYINITNNFNIRDRKRAMKQHDTICPFTSKDWIAKVRSLGIKCVSLLDINFDSFSLAKLC